MAPPHSTKIFLAALAEAADIVIPCEISGTSVAARTERVDLLGNIFQEFATTRDEANLGAVRGSRERNRFADAAACACDHGNLTFETLHEFCCGLRSLVTKTVVGRIPLVPRAVALRGG